MSNGEPRKASLQDVQTVRSLIERCLQLYMSQREVVNTLLQQAKIEPSFTEFVWQILEAENQDFFRAYNMRLIVKDQIFKFNQLLEKQVELMDQMSKGNVVPLPPQNGSEVHPKLEIPAYHAPQLSGLSINEGNFVPKNSGMPNVCGSMTSLQPCVQVGATLAASPGGSYDSPGNVMLSQGLNGGVRHGMNGTIIKTEDGYSGNPTAFGIDSNPVEHQNVVEASISPFNGGESHSQAVTDSLLDLEMNSFGFLGQIARNFNVSYLNTDFPNSADLLGNYSRSPFLPPEPNFMDSQIPGEQDLKKLGNISEGFGCEDFGSDL